MQGLCLVPSVMLTMPVKEAKVNVSHLAEMHTEDLIGNVQAEVYCWRVKWRLQSDRCGPDSQELPSARTKSLPHAGSLFSTVPKLLCILSTFPATMCWSERSHSDLKRIKTTVLVSHYVDYQTDQPFTPAPASEHSS